MKAKFLQLQLKIATLALAILLIVPYCLSSETVIAATSAQVTITATGIVVDAPGGFTVYYVSDYEVGISWTKPEGAVNTMIRAKYGSYPNEPVPGNEPTDGYLVYYGSNSSTSDTAVSLDETATSVYYRAWSETESGQWSPIYGEGEMEGIGMTLIALILLAIGFMVLGYVFRRMEILFAAAGAWIVLGFYSFSKSDSSNPAEITDIYMALFWLCIALVITCAMLPLVLREKKGLEEPDTPVDESKLMADEYKELEKGMYFPSLKSKRSRRLSRWERTGEE